MASQKEGSAVKLSLYLSGQILRFFALIYLSALAVFVLIDFVGNIEIWLSKPWNDALRYYGYYLPQISYLIMPIIVLLTTVVVVGNMARHLEIAAMKAAGIPVIRQVLPLLVFALTMTGAMFYLSDRVLPDANHKRLQIAQPKTKNSERNKREVDKYQFVFIGLNSNSYYFQHYNADRKSGEGVTLMLLEHGQVQKRYDAAEIHWQKNHWQLSGVQIRTWQGDSLKILKSPEWSLSPKEFVEHPEDLVDTRFKADEMTLAVMERKIQLQKHAGEDTKDLETQWHFRFASACVTFFVALFGLSLSHGVLRGGLAHGIMLGLGYAFLYYLGLRLGTILGMNGTSPPWLGAWLGNLIFGGIGLISFWRSIRL